MEPTQKTNLNIPIAIVLAGAIIAGAIFLRDRGPESRPVSPTGSTETGKIDIKPISAKDHILGSPSAPIIIVEYSDYECPFCKNFHTTMHAVIDTYGKDGSVAWALRHFPLYKGNPPLHSKAGTEAEASECAAELGGNNGFWKFSDRIFAVTPSNNGLNLDDLPKIAEFAGVSPAKFSECMTSGRYTSFIEESYNEAVKAGGRGTPFNVLVLKDKIPDGTANALAANLARFGDVYALSADKKKMVLNGAMPLEVMKYVIEIILDPSKAEAAVE